MTFKKPHDAKSYLDQKLSDFFFFNPDFMFASVVNVLCNDLLSNTSIFLTGQLTTDDKKYCYQRVTTITQ